MLTILKAFYNNDVFRKALVDVNDKAIKDNIEVAI